jgi:hypothetical protein
MAKSKKPRRQRNNPRLRLPLLSDRLVNGEDPEASFKINPFPDQTSDFTRSATSQAKRPEDSAELHVTVLAKGLELAFRDNAVSSPAPRLLIADKWVLGDEVVLHGPTENRLDRGNRVLHRRRTEIVFEGPFDLREMKFPHLCNTEICAEDSESPQKAVTVSLMRRFRLPGFDVFEKLVSQSCERRVEPLGDSLRFEFLSRPDFPHFPTSDFVVLVEINAFAVLRHAPEAAGLVQNRASSISYVP